MFLTVHAVAGEVLAESLTNNPWWVFVVGFISHFFVDALPHGDEDLGGPMTHPQVIRFLLAITLFDISIMIITQYILWRFGVVTNAVLFAAVFGAMLPDGLQVPDIVFPAGPRIFRWYRRAHERFHNALGIHLGIKKGLIFQALTLAILIAVLANI